MFILSYDATDDDLGPQAEEFDTQREAQNRACDLQAAGEGRSFEISNEDGDVLMEDAEITSYCASRHAGGGGGGGGGYAPVRRGRQRVTLTAAIFNERGQRFAVVQASDSVLNNSGQAQEAWNGAMRLLGMPVLLMGSRRRYGDRNLVNAFQNVHPSQITGWQRLTFSV